MFWNIHKSFLLLPIIFRTVVVVTISESNYGNSTDEFFDSWSSSAVKVNKLRFMWIIDEFSLLEQQIGQVLASPTFSATTQNECNWRLELYPQGVNLENTGYLSLYLRSVSCTAAADVKFGIVNAAGEDIENKEYFYEYKPDDVKGWNKFIKEELLQNENGGYLSDDTLTIFCEVNATSVSEEFSREVTQPPQKNDLELRKDLTFLIDNQLFSDVTVSAKEKNFQALKAILSARSAVFQEIFDQDTADSKVAQVYMTDLDAKVVRELLRYIYTDEASDLQDLNPDLLALAEKYQLDGLKTICENAMSANLTIENSAKFYILGDKYSAAKLKAKAKHFITAYNSDVIQTPGYISLLETHPHLAEELSSK